jgi:hypothetical protein
MKVAIETEAVSNTDPIWVHNAIKAPLSDANVLL